MIDEQKVISCLEQFNTGKIRWEEFTKNLQEIRDAEEIRENTCQVCKAVGEDRRNLWIACLYELSEISSMLKRVKVDDKMFYLLRICKECRADFIGMLGDFINRKAR